MLARPGSKEAWLASLLQMTLFRENTAGTGFYARLEALRRDPTRADVLLVYFVALSLGFRGRFASVDDVRRLELIECVHLDLLRAGAASEAPLAPSVRRPRTAMARQLRGRILLACGGASVLLAMGLWLVLELDLVLLVAAAVQG